MISQDAYSGNSDKIERLITTYLDAGETTVFCSHGPVLPQIVDAVLAVAGGHTGERSRASALSTGEYAVMHIPVEHPESGIVAIEVHSPTA